MTPQPMTWSNDFLDRHSQLFIWVGLSLLIAVYLAQMIDIIREKPPPHFCFCSTGAQSTIGLPDDDLTICD